MTRYSVLTKAYARVCTRVRQTAGIAVTVCHYKPICISDRNSENPSLLSEMSLGLVEIECPYILGNTDRLKEESPIIEKNHMPIIINAAGSNWI